MTARQMLYLLGFIALPVLLVWQISAEAAPSYPPEIQKMIERADIQFICERVEPRKVGTIVYLKRDEDWLVRIFTKDAEELEIWLNKSVSWSPIWLWFSLATANKIYYHDDGQWLNQNELPEEKSQQLYNRLRFTGGERSSFYRMFQAKNRSRAVTGRGFIFSSKAATFFQAAMR